ncbi:MAG: helix-turn-helix transcriptional regulator, partial [Verrucomicrobia bacterium]|nr:helix-turn-helix transcriptional regulator [Verrucomicrobiota bacterium]
DLTPREQQIMLHVCANRDEDEIARLLGISPGTVHGHMMKAFQKLGVHSREEALRKFVGLAGD